MKQNYIFCSLLIMLSFIVSPSVFSQSKVTPVNNSVATAKVINTFPHTEYNVNTANGGSASGMLGYCVSLFCCRVLVYKVVLPMAGSLRVDNDNFKPLAGSIIAYKPNVENPTTWSDLTYYSEPGNFCGFRDTLQLGRGYDWVGTRKWTDFSQLTEAGDYYILIFNENQQVSLGIGTESNFTFRFAPACPDGFSCNSTNITVCDADSYTSPTGKNYTTSGNYKDTISGVAIGGLDSLIFTSLTINNTVLVQDSLTDERLCPATEPLKHTATTNLTSVASFTKADKNWIAINDVRSKLTATNRSVFMWIKQSATVSSEGQILCGINTSSGGNICLLQINTSEKLEVYDGSSTHTCTTNITDGNWHYVGYTYDETTDSTKLYVDGMLENKFKNSQSVTSTSLISLGQEFDSGLSKGNFFEGEMTEVSIWDEVLEIADIELTMKKTIESTHPKYNNLQAYYPMIVSCGDDISVAKDFSENNYNGTVSHSTIQSTTSLKSIIGFDASGHYSKNWKLDNLSVSTADSINMTSYAEGNYQLKMSRDYFTITDSWEVTIDPTCITCTDSEATINPTATNSYTSPSGKYNWTISSTYKDTIPNAGGCDSIITINLTIDVSTQLKNNGVADIRIFPNPSNGIFTISSNSLKEFSHVIVRNTLGKAIRNEEITNNITSIDLSDYSRGVYFIELKGKEKSHFSKVILK